MQIELTLKRVLVLAGTLLVLAASLAAAFTVYRRGYESKIVDLQNQVAARDQTIEIKTGEFQRLDIQSKDLSALLNNKDQQLIDLQKRLDQQGAQLLAANTLVVQLKQKLTSTGNATVTNQPAASTPTEADHNTMLTAGSDQGPFHLDCEMDFLGHVAGPVGYKLSLSQPRPLRLSVIVSQDKDGTWRTSTTSSESSFQVDIALAGVNPYLLEPHWYEKIALDAEVGIGTDPGFLAGVGASYEIGHFEVGPKVWVVIDRGVSPFFGAQMAWHPFAK